MRRCLAAALSAIICVGACAPAEKFDTLRDADLVFVGDGGSEMDGAIAAATSAGRSFTHVAIIGIDASTKEVYVIEASPSDGVIRRPLSEFMAENSDLQFMRLKQDLVDELAAAQDMPADMLLFDFVLNARRHLGEPYDFCYLPDNDACYCSELVWDSFLREGPSPSDPHLFEARPMNFLDSEGQLPGFWKDLFEKMDMPVPQGVPGTNPEDLSRAPILEKINPKL